MVVLAHQSMTRTLSTEANLLHSIHYATIVTDDSATRNIEHVQQIDKGVRTDATKGQNEMTPETQTNETNVGSIPSTSDKKLIAKMSVKALGCNPRAAAAKAKDDTSPVVLCAIFGIADGVKSGEDNKGSVWTCLTGRFEGTNLQGEAPETFQSGKLFLPGGIQEVIEGAVKEMGDSGSVQFALELRAVRADNPIGYSYQAVPLVAPKQNDALGALRERVAARIPRLGAVELKALPEPQQTAQAPAQAAEVPQAPTVQAAFAGQGKGNTGKRR